MNKIALYGDFYNIRKTRGTEAAIEHAANYGYQGVEFLFGVNEIPSVSAGERYKALLNVKNLTVACVSCGASLVKENSPSTTDFTCIENLYRCIDFTKSVGSKLFHHTLYVDLKENPGIKYEDMYDAVVYGAELVANYAKERGITVIYEPQGWFFNGYNGFLTFFRDIKTRCKNVGVCFDVGNTYWVDEEPYRLFEAVKHDVMHTHIKDYTIGGASSEYKTISGRDIKEVTIGRGQIRLDVIFDGLSKIGYSGFYSIEDVTDVSPEEKLLIVSRMLKK